MPELGEIRKAKELGRPNTDEYHYIYAGCIDCGKERWIQFAKGKPRNLRCYSCAAKLRSGENSNSWKGGRCKKSNGYILIKLQPDNFFYSMHDCSGYVLEHRLIMAKSLGRNLHPWEIVHHKNHIRDDNRIGNLQLVSDDRHRQITILENKIEQLEQTVTKQTTQIKLLQWHIKQLERVEIESK